jgi:hypothetical protein
MNHLLPQVGAGLPAETFLHYYFGCSQGFKNLSYNEAKYKGLPILAGTFPRFGEFVESQGLAPCKEVWPCLPRSLTGPTPDVLFQGSRALSGT